MRWVVLLLIVAAAVPALGNDNEEDGFSDEAPSIPLPTAATMNAITGASVHTVKQHDESDADDEESAAKPYQPEELPAPTQPVFLRAAASEVEEDESTALLRPLAPTYSAASKAPKEKQNEDKDLPTPSADDETEEEESADDAPKSAGIPIHRLAGAVAGASSDDSLPSADADDTASAAPTPRVSTPAGPVDVNGRLSAVNGTLYVTVKGVKSPAPIDISLKLNGTDVSFAFQNNTIVHVKNGYQAQYSDGTSVLVVAGAAFPIVKGSNNTKVAKTPSGALGVTINGTYYVVDRLTNFVVVVDGVRTLLVNATVLNETVVSTKPVASWVPTFLTPNAELSLASSLYVWIPNNMTNALEVKQFQVRHLLGRMKELQVEISRLTQQFTDSEKLVDTQLNKQLVMQKNFHHLHRQHEKATRGPTIDDKKQSIVTQLPLVEQAKHLIDQQSKQLAMISAWTSASKLNIDMRVAFKRNVIRLQRMVGILALQAVMLPL